MKMYNKILILLFFSNVLLNVKALGVNQIHEQECTILRNHLYDYGQKLNQTKDQEMEQLLTFKWYETMEALLIKGCSTTTLATLSSSSSTTTTSTPNPAFSAVTTKSKSIYNAIKTLEGHTDAVVSLLWLSNGMLASASWDKTIKLWEPSTGQLLRTLEGHTGHVSSLAEHKKNGYLLSASYDKKIKMWDPNTGKLVRMFFGHYDSVRALADLENFGQNNYFASGSDDKTIKVWDANTGLCVRTFDGHSAAVTSLVKLNNGLLVSGSLDSTIKIWDLTNGQLQRTMKGHTAGVTSLVELKDYLVSGSEDMTIKFWDVKNYLNGKSLTAHTAGIHSLARLANGYLVSSANSPDRTVKVWTGEGVLTRTLDTAHYRSVVADMNNGMIAAGYLDKTVRLWQRELYFESNAGNTLHSTSSLTTSSPFKPNPLNFKHITTLQGHDGNVYNLAKLTSSGYVVSGATDDKIIVWDPRIESQIVIVRTLKGHYADISSLIELSNGNLASGSWDHLIKIWDGNNGQHLKTIITGYTSDVSSLVELKKSGYLVSGSGYGDGTIKIWDLKTLGLVKSFKAHSDRITGLVELKNGWLASSSEDMTIKLWDPSNGQLVKTLKEHTKWVTCLTELNNGQLASGSLDRTIKIWDINKGTSVKTLSGHTGKVTGLVQLKSNGNYLASTGDKTVKLWDVNTGQLVKSFEGHHEDVTSIVELNDGVIASGSLDKTIRLWG